MFASGPGAVGFPQTAGVRKLIKESSNPGDMPKQRPTGVFDGKYT